MKNIMITGASGMLGKALIRNLITYDELNVFAVTTNPSEYCDGTNKVNLLSLSEIKNVLEHNPMDYAVHLAFPRNVKDEDWAPGIKFSLDLLFMLKNKNVKRVINVTSQSLYGLQREKVADENDCVVLSSPYTTGKYCTEVVANNLFETGKYTNIRLATVIGPETDDKLINKFVKKIKAGEDIEIRCGKQRFTFLDIRDSVDALKQIILSEEFAWKEVYNLGGGECYSIMDLAKKCQEIGARFGYKNSTIKVCAEDIKLSTMLDSSLFEHNFKWHASFPIDETIAYIFNSQGN